MPFPLIPLALLAASITAGGKGVSDLRSASRAKRQARRNREAAEGRLERAQEEIASAHRQAVENVDRLIGVQLRGLAMLEEVVSWLGSGRVKYSEFTAIELPCPVELEEWSTAGSQATSALAGLAGSAVVGSGVQAATTGLVAKLGFASTGTAISQLSGAAARNSTLAWLGGGSLASGGAGMAAGTIVLGSLNVGAALLGVGLTARKVAAQYSLEQREAAAQLFSEAGRLDAETATFKEVQRRATKLRRATNGIAQALRGALDACDKGDSEDKSRVIVLARALGDLARYDLGSEANATARAWTNPYKPVRDLGLEPSDDDFSPSGDQPSSGL